MKKLISAVIAVIITANIIACNKNTAPDYTESSGSTETTVEEFVPYSFNTIASPPVDYIKGSDGPVIEQQEYTPVEKPNISDFFATAEFEDGELNGFSEIATQLEGFSGSGYATELNTSDDKVSLEIEIPETGTYDLIFTIMSPNRDGANNLVVDNLMVGKIITPKSDKWEVSTVANIEIEKGMRKFTVTPSTGYFHLDKIEIRPSAGIPKETYEVEAKLVNPNADENTRRLMKFLVDNYGKNVITGQTAGNIFAANEITAIYDTTGKYPAIAAFDMIEYSPSRIERGSRSQDVPNAIKWYNEENGIVTFCWHWNAPTRYLSDKPLLPNAIPDEDITGSNQPWWKGFYKEASDIDLAKIMNGEDEIGYQNLIADIDIIADQLKILQDAGVPVLWRPLHEASGGWFWWGNAGEDAFKKLWVLLYQRLTTHHQLNNLIWVFNGQSKSWYPGDEYVDIIGEDIYADKLDVSSQIERFNQARDYTDTKKIIALTENGNIPDIDKMFEDDVIWSWFATWEGEFIQEGGKISDKYTPVDVIIKAFNHKNTITLDELPDLKTYPLD